MDIRVGLLSPKKNNNKLKMMIEKQQMPASSRFNQKTEMIANGQKENINNINNTSQQFSSSISTTSAAAITITSSSTTTTSSTTSTRTTTSNSNSNSTTNATATVAPASTNDCSIIEEKRLLENGETAVLRRYSKGRFLGKGGFARCYEFTDLSDGKIYAGKVIAKSSITRERARRKLLTEIKIHRSLNHKNIVKFQHTFEDKENVYLILEMCNHKSLMDLIKRRKRLCEQEARFWCCQLIEAIRYLHENRVIHRDLKLGNVFIHNMEVKVGDFGLAARLDYDGERKKTICGTPNYIAPEILFGKQGHSYEVDIWSFGVAFYTMLVGKPPFETKDLKHTYRRIRANIFSFPSDIEVSSGAKSLIRQILHAVPENRLVLYDILQHPFFTQHFLPKNLPRSALLCKPEFPPTPPNIIPYSRSSPCHKALTESRTEHNNILKKGSMESNGFTEKETFKDKKENSCTKSLLRKRHANDTNSNGGIPSKFSSLKKTSSEELLRSLILAMEFLEPNTDTEEELDLNGHWPRSYVIKWSDLSDKYGLGYLLNSGIVGAYFNDDTKMIFSNSSSDCSEFALFKNSSINSSQQEKSLVNGNSHNLTHEIDKKVKLMKYLCSMLVHQSEKENIAQYKQKHDKVELLKDGTPFFVRNWLRTNNSIVFRLNDSTIQVNFFDHSKIILSAKARIVTYVDKNKSIRTKPLKSILKNAGDDLLERLIYTRDLMTLIRSGNN